MCVKVKNSSPRFERLRALVAGTFRAGLMWDSLSSVFNLLLQKSHIISSSTNNVFWPYKILCYIYIYIYPVNTHKWFSRVWRPFLVFVYIGGTYFTLFSTQHISLVVKKIIHWRFNFRLCTTVRHFKFFLLLYDSHL
jgi:hypothetical protein